jgi:hypothetical protein
MSQRAVPTLRQSLGARLRAVRKAAQPGAARPPCRPERQVHRRGRAGREVDLRRQPLSGVAGPGRGPAPDGRPTVQAIAQPVCGADRCLRHHPPCCGGPPRPGRAAVGARSSAIGASLSPRYAPLSQVAIPRLASEVGSRASWCRRKEARDRRSGSQARGGGPSGIIDVGTEILEFRVKGREKGVGDLRVGAQLTASVRPTTHTTSLRRRARIETRNFGLRGADFWCYKLRGSSLQSGAAPRLLARMMSLSAAPCQRQQKDTP